MFPLIVILNRLPLAPAALPAFIATMGISDFPTPLLPPLLLRLVGKRVGIRQRQCRDLLGYRMFSVSGSKRSKIPGGNNGLAFNARCFVVCRPIYTFNPFQMEFRDSIPSRSALSVTIVPRQFSHLRIKQPVTRLPERLDTRPVANSYRDGIRTR